MKLLHQLIKFFWLLIIISVGLGQEPGCMDDGYQQWSPNLGSPACNYNQDAIVEGECLYNDCLGDCQEILDNDGNWIPNSVFTNTQYDGCGECGGDGSTCSDCNGVPNGIAYIDVCDQCVGGDTGIPDCLNIDLSFGGYMESNSSDTIKVFVTNLDTLKSLDIEFQYDSSIINITDFSLYGTALYNIGYEIAYDSFIEAGNFTKVNFILYSKPLTNTDTLFSPNGEEHIFNIVLEAMEIEADITTQIIINEFSVNEILMDETNWAGGEILVAVSSGCTDPDASNYNPDATIDDGSCFYCDLGDVDCDGELNVLDIVSLVNIIMDDGEYTEYGDVNGDGYLNILDVVTLVNLVLFGNDGACVDMDGNVYETIQIGDQLWMAENLKVTHYNDGSEIPNITNNGDWGGLSTGAYGDYDNNPTNSETYGRLYNWHTVDDSRGVCPEGFHVPTDGEWTTLSDYLGGEDVAGGKMKSTGTIEDADGLWNYQSDEITEEATNESGFTGLPAGYRYSSGNYYYVGSYGYFWSSTEYSSNYAWYRLLYYNYSGVYHSTSSKRYGFSIRCLGD